MSAAAASDLPAMLQLIRRSADVNAMTSSVEMTSLCFCVTGDIDATRMLIDAGAGDGPAASLSMALAIAVENTQTALDLSRIELLRQARADVNSRIDGLTPLHRAVFADIRSQDIMAQLVERLVKAGAELECEMGRARTPLCTAVQEGYLSVVRVLIEAGADLEVADHYPVFSAARHGFVEILNLLITSGASIPHVCYTALMVNISSPNRGTSIACVKALFEAGDSAVPIVASRVNLFLVTLPLCARCAGSYTGETHISSLSFSPFLRLSVSRL